MITLRKLSQLRSDYGWLLITLIWYASIVYCGYTVADAVKKWGKSHIIFIHETCTTDSDCEGVE